MRLSWASNHLVTGTLRLHSDERLPRTARHEKRNGGQHDANWPDWYAEYMVAEHTGKELPLYVTVFDV